MSQNVSCPIESGHQVLLADRILPDSAVACPQGRDGSRDNCYSLEAVFRNGRKELITCAVVDFTVVPAARDGKCPDLDKLMAAR